eukprot:3402906-Heterocapsa_arctica.AAC.1
MAFACESGGGGSSPSCASTPRGWSGAWCAVVASALPGECPIHGGLQSCRDACSEAGGCRMLRSLLRSGASPRPG